MAYEQAPNQIPDGGTHDAPLLNPNINVPRLFEDLRLTEADLGNLNALQIPFDVYVPSTSQIKTSTVTDALRIVQPGRAFNVVGVKVPSGVDEQPLGQTTIDGALNRLGNVIRAREEIVPDEGDTAAWFSIENGLFRVGQQPEVEAVDRIDEGVVQFTEGADLAARFDPNAEYEDRAVTAIRIPGYPTVLHISPASEAVRFPRDAVMAAANADGGLTENTAGSMLAEMGIVVDKQNPHTELTADRPGGPLPRQDQMARVIIRSLVRLANENTQPTPYVSDGS